jgi:zinc/manganese transport system substrate-binding protein
MNHFMPRLKVGAVIALTTLLASTARAELNVVATLPDLAALAEAVGAGKLKVTSLARPTEDAHFVDPKPSFIRVLNQADVLIEGGADLEIGWLPPLVQGARNRKIVTGGAGLINAAEGLDLLGVATGPVDRSQGDVHGRGNPHYLLDPVRAGQVATHIADAFARLEPASADAFTSANREFQSTLTRKVESWTRLLAPFKGTKVVTYHKSFDYLLGRFGLVLTDTIEPKPGIEPSPTHITALIPRIKEQGVKLVLIEDHRPAKTPKYVAEQAGAELVVLPHFPGGHKTSETYLEWMDHLIGELAAALQQP